jgi:hypothetical protein
MYYYLFIKKYNIKMCKIKIPNTEIKQSICIIPKYIFKK